MSLLQSNSSIPGYLDQNPSLCGRHGSKSRKKDNLRLQWYAVHPTMVSWGASQRTNHRNVTTQMHTTLVMFTDNFWTVVINCGLQRLCGLCNGADSPATEPDSSKNSAEPPQQTTQLTRKRGVGLLTLLIVQFWLLAAKSLLSLPNSLTAGPKTSEK
jgi:hypothetical protein